MDSKMISLLIRLALVLLGKWSNLKLRCCLKVPARIPGIWHGLFWIAVLNHLFTPCSGLRSSGGKGYLPGRNEGKGYKDPAKPNSFQGTSAGVPGQKTTRRGLGISAWGIIMVIVTLILAGMGFYYFSMCYPILCRKQRKYDMIELDKV